MQQGTPGECYPVGAAMLSWLRREPVGGPVIGMCKAQETGQLPERDSCWQEKTLLAVMCQNVSSGHEEICFSCV